jgi:hypothetical protein
MCFQRVSRVLPEGAARTEYFASVWFFFGFGSLFGSHTEIMVPKQYRVRTGAEYSVTCRPIFAGLLSKSSIGGRRSVGARAVPGRRDNVHQRHDALRAWQRGSTVPADALLRTANLKRPPRMDGEAWMAKHGWRW